MRKTYSTVMMLAMMVAALSFTACGGDDDDNDDIGNGGGDSSSSYIEVKFDGDTYREAIPEWICAQIDNMGTDSQGKKLTYTYDMVAHFKNNYGFNFMFGIVHYRNRADLLASSPGSYLCGGSISDRSILNNLTFYPLFELDGDEYDLVDGYHNVRSIQSVGGDVRIEGSFTTVFERRGDTKNIQGSYSILIPF
jgi:hypothetical protein